MVERFKRYANATLSGYSMTPLLHFTYEDLLAASSGIQYTPTKYPEQDCLLRCMEKSNCYAVQVVYNNSHLNESNPLASVKWCTLLDVGSTGADVTAENQSSLYGPYTAFQHLEDWDYFDDLDQEMIGNDYKGNHFAIFIKGTNKL